MRRKSERNKAKSSPEKKAEKPTRKSTRRRGRRSPSTSPDREETSNDGGTLSTRESDGESTTHTRDCCAKIDEAPENKVSSTETIVKQKSPEHSQQQQQQQPTAAAEEEDDAGSVWKVARADASPGEIQKLKLCRQRNMSETSDASSSRKRTNKWHEGGEGVAEEVDSADEPLSAGSKIAVKREEPAEETNSAAPPGRDSSEEVSDSKEIPPESASAELSDDKPNIDDDRQGDNTPTTTTTTSMTTTTTTTTMMMMTICTAVERVDDNNDEPSIGPERTIDQTNQQQQQQQSSDDTTIIIIDPANIPADKNDADNVVVVVNNSEKRPGRNNDDDDKTPDISKKLDQTEQQSDSSDDDDNNMINKTARPQTLTRTSSSRRKHRDKYRDSSNSDTAESEDDSETANKTEENSQDDKVDEKETNFATAINNVSTRPETPVDNDNDAPTETLVNNIIIIDNDNNKSKDKENIDDESQLTDAAPVVIPSLINYKPAKVNLKRSFAGRISAETKKEPSDNDDTSDLANQNKENDASSQAKVEPKFIPKKRRWGTMLTSTDATPSFSVSTDSLKVLVPGAKPLSINEVRLSKDDDDEKERRSQRDKRDTGGDHKSREDGEKPKTADANKDSKGDNYIARRKISIIKDTSHGKSPSPPAAIATSILLIKNLVRPFTLNQIRELLSRTGTIVDNGFWMDRIKSKCFVEYSNEDQAFETRQALHGISWPVSNPKRLQVEYATKEDMASARELSKDQPISRKTEPLAVNDGWQQDWARDERPNAATKVTVVREWDLGKEDGQHFAKDKDREKKENDKKRRQRSRSPILEAHLPAPARKFKKKEDDPPPAKLLDDLFRKTKSTPCIYWLPLTNEQIVVKEEMRRQHMAEHARRLEEMRRAERNRDGRRRRSPRK